MSKRQVMLARSGDPDDPALQYPMLVSPKLDGVRARVMGGKLWSRKHKRIPNKQANDWFGRKDLEGLDGELVVGEWTDPLCFNKTQKLLSTREAYDRTLRFVVFDHVPAHKPDASFQTRQAMVKFMARRNENVVALPHVPVNNRDELKRAIKTAVGIGHEGLMGRDPQGLYKHGRCGKVGPALIKFKVFEDAEALVLKVLPAMKNNNPQKKNALGRMSRSSHKANKVRKPIVGKFLVKDLKTKKVFKVGRGRIKDKEARAIWASRKKIEGKRILKYRHQPHGQKNKPRIALFIGWRDKWDM